MRPRCSMSLLEGGLDVQRCRPLIALELGRRAVREPAPAERAFLPNHPSSLKDVRRA